MPEFTQFDSTKVDDAELAAERRRRLAAMVSERLQPLAAPARHDDGQRAAGQSADVATEEARAGCFGMRRVALRRDCGAMLPLKPMTATRQREMRELLASLERDFERIRDARHHDPHSILGRHQWAGQEVLVVYLPATKQVRANRSHELQRHGSSDFFYWHGAPGTLPAHYTISWQDDTGGVFEVADPTPSRHSSTPSTLNAFNNGVHRRAHQFLGAHARDVEGIGGVQFAVWAPNAERVSVVGPFNLWDGRRHPMRVRGSSGVWELFHSRDRPWNTLQIRDPQSRQRHHSPQDRPLRAAIRATACHRGDCCDSAGPHVAGPCMDGEAFRRRLAVCTDVDLRGAPGFVAAKR